MATEFEVPLAPGHEATDLEIGSLLSFTEHGYVPYRQELGASGVVSRRAGRNHVCMLQFGSDADILHAIGVDSASGKDKTVGMIQTAIGYVEVPDVVCRRIQAMAEPINRVQRRRRTIRTLAE